MDGPLASTSRCSWWCQARRPSASGSSRFQGPLRVIQAHTKAAGSAARLLDGRANPDPFLSWLMEADTACPFGSKMHLGAENRCSSLIRSGWFLADGSVLVLSCAAPAEVRRQILRVVGVPLQRPRPLCGGRTTSAASRLLPVQKKTETGAGTKKDLLRDCGYWPPLAIPSWRSKSIWPPTALRLPATLVCPASCSIEVARAPHGLNFGGGKDRDARTL